MFKLRYIFKRVVDVIIIFLTVQLRFSTKYVYILYLLCAIFSRNCDKFLESQVRIETFVKTFEAYYSFCSSGGVSDSDSNPLWQNSYNQYPIPKEKTVVGNLRTISLEYAQIIRYKNVKI
jgi:hypothetical protein